MKTTAKKLSDTSIELKVTLDAKDLKMAREKALEKLAREVSVEGFRKGKVPAKVAEKFIPENDLNAEMLDFAVRSTVLKAFAENEKSPLVIPNVNVTKFVPGEMVEYTATADILPEIKLADFKKLEVKKPEVKVADKDVNGALENLRKSFAEKKAIKRAAKNTDEVIIDFTGKKDGKEFAGGKAKDYHLELGSGTFIPGFEDGIVGHEPGDKFELELTFPKDYGVKELAGAKTVFEVLLKQVNEVKLPELDDKLAKQCGPFKKLDELKADIKKNLEMQSEHQLMEKYKDDLVSELVKKSKISAPEILIKDQLKFIKDDIERNAAAQGMKFEDYLERVGQKMEDWEKEARKIAEARVKASLALQILAREQKIAIEEAVVEAKIAELRDVYKKSPEAIKSLKDPAVKNDIRNRMIIEKTLEFLVNAQK